MRTAKRLVIEGRVQGVGYRYWAEGTASELGLSGWVRNLRDGRVEMSIAGDAGQIAKMIEACWKGPRPARVDQVRELPQDDEGWPDFSTRPTL
jgi:acylphosphatase